MFQFYDHPGIPWTLFIPILIWVLFWKGYSLWTAAKLGHKGWFLALLVLNTLGILEIIYVFRVAKKKWTDIEKSVKRFLK